MSTKLHECKQREEDQRFEETCKDKKYQKCYECDAMVELAEACNHMM